jgi:UDP-N-acetylmuramate--alanine ligase
MLGVGRVRGGNGGARRGAPARRVHFVGIGGIGMSGIAEVLLNLGYPVSGSDLAERDTTLRLAALGAEVRHGHDPDRVTSDIAVVVTSSAVTGDNPEVARARALGIPVIPRAEMLAELMRVKVGVAVAGTHGKTTTTSLVAAVLHEAGFDPTMVVGGKLRTLGTNARLGQGDYLVAEADESDGSFLLLSPTVAVVTNVDPEHLDHYGNMDRVREAYLTFLNRVPFYGVGVVCADDPNLQRLLSEIRKPVRTYGESQRAEYRVRDLRVTGTATTFRVSRGDEHLGAVTLGMPGRHHALNALAAIVVGDELGVPFGVAVAALAGFGGIHRRFEVLGEVGGVMVVDDYGHHPTEIAATIRAAREGFDRRLVVVFQPHRFTRTRDLFEDFVPAFAEADVVVLTEIYAAGERPIDGVSGQALHAALVRQGGQRAHFVAERERVATVVRDLVRPGDLVLVLGAGDIGRCGSEIFALLGDRAASETAAP